MPDLSLGHVLPSFYEAARREYEGAAARCGSVQRRLRFDDRTVELRFAGKGLAATLLGALAGSRHDCTDDVHATISLWEADSCGSGPVPFPWRWTDVGPGGLVGGSGAGNGTLAIHETCYDALTLVDADGRTMLHRVPSRDVVPWWERAAPLRHCLFFALCGDGRHLVHASAVGNDHGCVLLVGARGSGKTTVAMAALNHGLAFVADDYLILRAGDPPEAVALYSTASLSGGLDAEEKSVVDLAALMPDSLRASLPIRAIVAPRIRGGRSALSRVSGAVALRAWAPTTAFQMPYDNGAVVASLAHVARKVACYVLDVGDDERELAGAVVEVLGDSL